MIEHLKKEDGEKLLNAIHVNYIFSTPKNLRKRQCVNNPYESHISQWYPKDFHNYIFYKKSLIGYRIDSKMV